MDEIKDYEFTDEIPQRTLNFKLLIPIFILDLALIFIVLIRPASLELNFIHYLLISAYFGAAALLMLFKNEWFFPVKK